MKDEFLLESGTEGGGRGANWLSSEGYGENTSRTLTPSGEASSAYGTYSYSEV